MPPKSTRPTTSVARPAIAMMGMNPGGKAGTVPGAGLRTPAPNLTAAKTPATKMGTYASSRSSAYRVTLAHQVEKVRDTSEPTVTPVTGALCPTGVVGKGCGAARVGNAAPGSPEALGGIG